MPIAQSQGHAHWESIGIPARPNRRFGSLHNAMAKVKIVVRSKVTVSPVITTTLNVDVSPVVKIVVRLVKAVARRIWNGK